MKIPSFEFSRLLYDEKAWKNKQNQHKIANEKGKSPTRKEKKKRGADLVVCDIVSNDLTWLFFLSPSALTCVISNIISAQHYMQK